MQRGKGAKKTLSLCAFAPLQLIFLMPYSDSSAARYQQERLAYWEAAAARLDTFKTWGGYYHRRLAQIYQNLVAPGLKVLELGCGQGDLLAALQPAVGVGVDFSAGILARARHRHPELRFEQADVHQLTGDDVYDVIILSDLLNDVWDVQTVFEQAARLAGPHTRLIINTYSRLWEPPLLAAQKLGLAQPVLYGNWLTVEDLSNLANLAGFEVIRHWQEVLCPLPIPLLDAFCNRFLVKLWPFNELGLTNFLILRPQSVALPQTEVPLVSVLVPARNEAGNIPEIFARLPQMGCGTELIFVEGHSRDNTYEAIQTEMARYPEIRCQLLKQTGIGKGNAVREGFAAANGDILMILDADLTVPPEDLPRFYEALVSGKGELINGVRLVYPMEKQAMRFLNLLGNKFFTIAFSWVLGQPIKDTLCGTKVLWRSDYEQIARNRAYFGDFDPFGDYDLIFGAVRLNRKIVDIPIRYRERKYGSTNIDRWKHGWLLFKMLGIAARRLKFI
jgi:ubiquinone/menaquinone biosynthesis C-methylase UbiE